MRKLLILMVVLLAGCDFEKEYTVTVNFETKGFAPSKEKWTEVVKAENDSIAYYRGALAYYVHEKVANDFNNSVATPLQSYEHVSFEVEDEEGFGVTDNLSDSTRTYLEKVARERAYR